MQMNGRNLPSLIWKLAFFALFATAPKTFAQDEPVGINAASQEQQTSLHPLRPVRNLSDLINKLRARGRKVGRGQKVAQPFFSVPGRIITIDGEDVQVFQYANAKSAKREAKAIDQQGSSVGTSMPMWVAPPHFYKSGRLIVLYVGQNSSVIRALEGVFGPQFAGK